MRNQKSMNTIYHIHPYKCTLRLYAYFCISYELNDGKETGPEYELGPMSLNVQRSPTSLMRIK